MRNEDATLDCYRHAHGLIYTYYIVCYYYSTTVIGKPDKYASPDVGVAMPTRLLSTAYVT